MECEFPDRGSSPPSSILVSTRLDHVLRCCQFAFHPTSIDGITKKNNINPNTRPIDELTNSRAASGPSGFRIQRLFAQATNCTNTKKLTGSTGTTLSTMGKASTTPPKSRVQCVRPLKTKRNPNINKYNFSMPT